MKKWIQYTAPAVVGIGLWFFLGFKGWIVLLVILAYVVLAYNNRPKGVNHVHFIEGGKPITHSHQGGDTHHAHR